MHLAARYGVSGSFLARVCERLRVPRPPTGYWAKLAVGKAPPRPPLPTAEPGDETEWMPNAPLPATRSTKPKPTPPKADPSDTVRAVSTDTSVANITATAAESEPAPTVPVSNPATKRESPRKRIPATHPLIAGALELIPQGKTSSEGYYKPRKRLLPDILTSPKQLDTIVRLANRLYRHLEAQGHRVRLSNASDAFQREVVDPRPATKQPRYHDSLWHPERPTVVYVDGVAIGLSLFETLVEKEMMYVGSELVPVPSRGSSNKVPLVRSPYSTTQRNVPSGEFCLQAYSPYRGTTWRKQWRGSAGALGTQLDEITETLQAAPTTINAQVEKAHQEQQRRQREWEESVQKNIREEQAKRRAKAIETSRAQLRDIITEWSEGKRVAAFFAELLADAKDCPPEMRAQVQEKLAAALALFGSDDTLARLTKWQDPEDIYQAMPKSHWERG